MPDTARPHRFENFRASDFEVWLRGGLEAYLHEKRGAWAFPGAEGEIASPAHAFLYQGLHHFYRGLPALLRAQFRLGLANVLASLEPTQENVPLFEEILSLAATLPAPEILRVLPGQVGNGFFGAARGTDGENLFELTLLTVARLAAPRDDSVDCLRTLVTSAHHFHCAYSGVALEALCRADDRALVSHMTLLRSAIRAKFDAYAVNEQAKSELAATLLDAVGLERMVTAWPNLLYFDRHDENAAIDGWLLLGLMKGPDAPLVSERDDDGRIIVSARANKAIWVTIPEFGSGFHDMLDLLEAEQMIGPQPTEAGFASGADEDYFDLVKSFGLDPETLRIPTGVGP